MTEKKQNNKSFILTVVLMISLILALTLPTAIAWFTDSESSTSSTTINFGSVAIASSDGVAITNTSSSARGINYILPGDVINLSFEVYNAGNVDAYAKIYYEAKVIYDGIDITPLLFDETDPETQPYLTVTDISLAYDEHFYDDGNLADQVFVLSKDETQGNGKTISGILEFAKTLPNSVSDGINTYVLNNAPAGTILELQIEIAMATIQKDNISLSTAGEHLSLTINSMVLPYTLTFVNGTPSLTIGNTVIETSSYYDVSSNTDSSAYAFVAEIDGQKTLLAVVGEGNMSDYSTSTQPWKDARLNITESKIEDGITSIGSCAFYGCTNLTSVEIPDSVTSIGNNSFRNCASLTSIEIPDSVTSIGGYAFRNDTNLTNVDLGDSVQTIGEQAFANCSGLTSVIIPDSVQTIGDSAFNNCTSLTSVDIGDSVQTIDVAAFYNCTSLTSIVIPNSVTTIGNSAFHNCTSLTSVDIGDSVTSISNYAFESCAFTSIVIPNSVQTFGNVIFNGCQNLTAIYMEHTSSEGLTLGSNWNYSKSVYYYSETAAEDCWHYVDGVPTLW